MQVLTYRDGLSFEIPLIIFTQFHNTYRMDKNMNIDVNMNKNKVHLVPQK